MTTNSWKIGTAELGFSVTDPGKTIDTATIADFNDFSCQIVGAEIVPTQNSSDDPIPATFCRTAQNTTTPEATQFTLDVDFLSDPHIPLPDGLLEFLWTNDAGEINASVWFYLAQQSGAAPKAMGKVFLGPGVFGGTAGETQQDSKSWPCDGRPSVKFGVTADASQFAAKSAK